MLFNVWAVIKAAPILYKAWVDVVNSWQDYEYKLISDSYKTHDKKRDFLYRSIKGAKNDEQRKMYSILLYDLDHGKLSSELQK